MPQARILDYVVIRRDRLTVNDGQTSDGFGFRVPSDAVTGRADSLPAVSFQARPPASGELGGSVDLNVIVNGLPTGVVGITLDTVRAVWRTFSEPTLNVDSSANFVQFRSDAGRVHISDVVVWFQRNAQW